MVRNVVGLLLLCASATTAATTCTATITTYPGYTGTYSSSVKGYVKLTEGSTSDDLKVYYTLQGVATSAGGLHVHTGTTCDSDAAVGNHYYTGGTDPWSTTYIATTDGKPGYPVHPGSFSVTTGYPIADNINHAIVVHDASGTRIGCGICVQDSDGSDLSPGAVWGIVLGIAAPLLLGLFIYISYIKCTYAPATATKSNHLSPEDSFREFDLTDTTKPTKTSGKNKLLGSNGDDQFDISDPTKAPAPAPAEDTAAALTISNAEALVRGSVDDAPLEDHRVSDVQTEDISAAQV